jgi:hypothetical protein
VKPLATIANSKMTEQEIIRIHLTLNETPIQGGKKIQSCLTAALREARHITGRDSKTGIPDPINKCGYLGSWTGAMCYLTILDQIGTCYRPINEPVMNNSAIQRSLKYFAKQLSDEEIDAIYALRNAFFHDFSLYNRNSKSPSLQHTFSVGNHPSARVVILPSRQWDGKMKSRANDNNTFINLKTLGDVVETIYTSLIHQNENAQLCLDLPEGSGELLDRYTMVY